MKINYLKYLMADADLKQIDVSDQLGVKPQVVNAVVNGQDRSKRVEEHIADKLGMEPGHIWPLTKRQMAA